MDTITITVAENDPDVIVSATLNEDAVTIVLNEAAVGATGAGVAAGGVANDILKKTSATNYATAWETPTSAATANTVVRRDASGDAAFNSLTSDQIKSTIAAQSIDFSPGAFLINLGGIISFAHSTAFGTYLQFSPTVARYITFPNASGNLAICSSTTGAIASADITDATSAATANTVVRRDASGGAAFVALTGTGNWSTTGHFFSNPGTAEAGHFITKNGTTPTLVAGRSAWFSDASGSPQFKNGTSSAITLIYSGGPLGTPSSGTLTSCTGLPISTGVSGLGTGVATLLAGTPSGTGGPVGTTSPTLTTPTIGAATGTTLTLGTTLPTATICNVYSSGSSSGNVWRGRMTVGGDTARFLMGEINGQAWLGAHNAALNAWNDFYINPDGGAKVGIGDLGSGSGNVAVPILTVDNTTLNTIITTSATSTAPLLVSGPTSSVDTLRIQGTTTASYSSIGFIDSGGTQRGSFGYAGTTAGSFANTTFVNAANGVPLTLGTNSVERIRIATSGGVSIGTTTDAGATNLLVAGSTKSNAGFIYGTFTVSTFPSTTYLEAVVTDALTPVIGAAVAAGGSAKCKVMYNGSAKIVTAVL